MYHKRLEYLQNIYPEDRCASAMMADDLGESIAGTPCIIRTSKFFPYIAKRDIGKKIYILEELPPDELKKIGVPTGRNIREVTIDLGVLRKLQSKGLVKVGDVQEVIRTCGITLTAVAMLSPVGAFTEHRLSGVQAIYRDKVPLIHDSIQEVSSSDIRNIYSEGELENFPSIIDDNLGLDVRSMNITLTDIKKSRIDDIQATLRDIINQMSQAYPHNICINHPENTRIAPGIIDVVSISFYDLDDFIPIFDVKKGRSIAVEVLFTNSEFNPDSVVQNSILYTFAFAKQRENLFVIDGEVIERSLDLATPRALKGMLNKLVANIPNDIRKPKKKTTDRRKQVCAE